MSDERKHLDDNGRPYCGTKAEGALVVDEPVDVTCNACFTRLSLRLRYKRAEA